MTEKSQSMCFAWLYVSFQFICFCYYYLLLLCRVGLRARYHLSMLCLTCTLYCTDWVAGWTLNCFDTLHYFVFSPPWPCMHFIVAYSLKCHSMRFFDSGNFCHLSSDFFPDFRSCYYWIRKIWNKSQLCMHSKVKLEIAQYTFFLDLQTWQRLCLVIVPLQILFGTNIMQVKANDKISTPPSNQNHYLYPSVILFCIF